MSMGFLESAVVIYMREILYPGGFAFPLQPVPRHLLLTEILREAATIIMLVCAGILAARKMKEWFAWFLYSFAVWDIFYYIFLKIMIGWPESLLTWDVLFLIPVVWTGPVIAPILLCALMIWLAVLTIRQTAKGSEAAYRAKEWIILITGSLLVVIAFCMDYTRFMLKEFSPSEIIDPAFAEKLLLHSSAYVPEKFCWSLFLAGIACIVAGILLIRKRLKSKPTEPSGAGG